MQRNGIEKIEISAILDPRGIYDLEYYSGVYDQNPPTPIDSWGYNRCVFINKYQRAEATQTIIKLAKAKW